MGFLVNVRESTARLCVCGGGDKSMCTCVGGISCSSVAETCFTSWKRGRVPSSATRVLVPTQKHSSHHEQKNENTELIGIIGCKKNAGTTLDVLSFSFLISSFEIILLYSMTTTIFSKIQ